MKRRRFCLFIGLGLLPAVLVLSCSTQSYIRHYQGDGEIKANPYYGLAGGGGGYTLKFEPFKLDHPAHFVYRFSGLPRWGAMIFFAIEDSRTWEDKHLYEWYQQTASAAEKQQYNYACYDDLTGTLAISLKDTEGKVILQFKKRLSNLTWGHGQGPYELYDWQAVYFNPDNREYVLEITIDPDPILKDVEGYVLIRGGGREPISIGF